MSMSTLGIKHNVWSFLNIVYFLIYVYLVFLAIFLVIKYEEEMKYKQAIFNGLVFNIIIDSIMLFIFFMKGILIIVYKKDKKIKDLDLYYRIVAMEWFSSIPSYIHCFYLLAQILYFYSDKFTNKKELIQIKEFREYCIIKIISGILFLLYFGLLNLYVFITKFSYVCYNCCYCKEDFFEKQKYTNKIYPR